MTLLEQLHNNDSGGHNLVCDILKQSEMPFLESKRWIQFFQREVGHRPAS